MNDIKSTYVKAGFEGKYNFQFKVVSQIINRLILLVTYILLIKVSGPSFQSEIMFRNFLLYWVPVTFFSIFVSTLIVSIHYNKINILRINLFSYLMLPCLFIFIHLVSKYVLFQQIIYTGITIYVAINIVMLISSLTLKQHPIPFLHIFLIIVLLYFSITGIFLSQTPLIGDEPYFLLIAYSLIHDHDLNLENNYINNDSLKYMDKKLQPQQWDNYIKGSLRSRHSACFPLLILPFFFIGKRIGVVLFINIITAFLGSLIYIVSCFLTKSNRISLISTFAVFFFLPMLIYSSAIYTEPLGALLGVIILYLVLTSRGKNKISLYIKISLLILVSGWLKTRFLILTVPIFVAHVLLNLNKKRIIIAFVILLLIFVLIVYSNIVLYGNVLGRYSFSDVMSSSFQKMLRGIFAQIWDVQYGAIPLNPFVALLFCGVYFLIKYRKHTIFIPILSAIIPYYFLLSAYAELIGGICPRGRFIVGWLPFAVLLVAFSHLSSNRFFFRLVRTVLMIYGFAHAFLITSYPMWRIDLPGGADRILESISCIIHYDLSGLFPSFDRIDEFTWQQTTFLTMLLLVITIILQKKKKVNQYNFTLITPSAVNILLIIFWCIPIYIRYLSTQWLEVEDKTFVSENGYFFWEEPYYWETHSKSIRPYICGIKLLPGGIVKRNIQVQKTKHAIKVIAKGTADNGNLPELALFQDNKMLNIQKIRSDIFEPYFFSIPTNYSFPKSNFFFKNVSPDYSLDIYIDKIKFTSNKAVKKTFSKLPFYLIYREFTINDILFASRKIKSNDQVSIQIRTALLKDVNDNNVQKGKKIILRFKSGTRVWDISQDLKIPGETDISFKWPFKLGGGKFKVYISCSSNGHYLIPTETNCFRHVNFYYIDDLFVTVNPAPPDENISLLLRKELQKNIQILPYQFYLGKGDKIDVTLKHSHVYYDGFAMISNLTSIFEEISFNSSVGSVSFYNQDSEIFRKEIIIGKDTAEDMLEFPGLEIRIAHSRPQIIQKVPCHVNWPSVFKNITYNSLQYYKYISFPEKKKIDRMVIRTQNINGLLNIYALGLTY